MTNLLDQHDSKDDKGKIEHLEAELERVEYAFEDYITTSRGLEVDVKIALRDMRKLSYIQTTIMILSINFLPDRNLVEIVVVREKVK